MHDHNDSTSCRAIARLSSMTIAASLLLVACGSKEPENDPEPQPTTYAKTVLGALDRTAIEKTRQDMLAVRTALQGYQSASGEFPTATSYEALAPLISPNHIRRLPKTDAWGYTFTYKRVGDGFELAAPGVDGEVGTGDDIALDESGFTKLPDNYKPLK